MKIEIVAKGDHPDTCAPFEVWGKNEDDVPARDQPNSVLLGSGDKRGLAIAEALRTLYAAVDDLEHAMPL